MKNNQIGIIGVGYWGTNIVNALLKIGVRNISTDDETQGFLVSVVPTLPRMGGISFTKKFGAY